MIRAGRLYLTRPEPSEGDVLSACLELLARHPDVQRVWRQNVGAGKFIRPDGSTSQFIRFGFPGLSDICGVMRRPRGVALFVETKRPSGRRREEQDAFLAEMRAAGAIAGRVRSVDELLRLLREASQ